MDDGITLLLTLFFFIIGAALLYWIIKTAVRHALISHYKMIRLYEATGEWEPQSGNTRTPRTLDSPNVTKAQPR